MDFLDFYWKNYHWPAFNVADIAIFLGSLRPAGGLLPHAASLLRKLTTDAGIDPLIPKRTA